MIFVTVGTEYPFDRLIRTIDGLIAQGFVEEIVFAQIGHGKYVPRFIQWVKTMPRTAFEKKILEADAIIGHAGMGTILSCLRAQKPLLVMPRLKRYKEVVSDHQIATAKRFESLNYLLATYSEENLAPKIEQLYSFKPNFPRIDDSSGVIARVRLFLEKLSTPQNLA